jgi:hypothetical protein
MWIIPRTGGESGVEAKSRCERDPDRDRREYEGIDDAWSVGLDAATTAADAAAAVTVAPDTDVAEDAFSSDCFENDLWR